MSFAQAAPRATQERTRCESPILRPRIGVCSLNPHGGEGGLFGDEELRIIRPAVERGLAEGLRLEGPLPTDTLMVRARDGRFDAVVAMYHDQGHIALKLLGMHRAVNVTLGLPIIRTSVAHGTAFDIAWKRQAETGSMIEALRVASRLAAGRDQWRVHEAVDARSASRWHPAAWTLSTSMRIPAARTRLGQIIANWYGQQFPAARAGRIESQSDGAL